MWYIDIMLIRDFIVLEKDWVIEDKFGVLKEFVRKISGQEDAPYIPNIAALLQEVEK